jgi:FKBP-type peptidyl-prolyl cis-trans isomerase SlyD
MASCIEPNALVVLDYTLRLEGGEVVDASGAEGGEPMVYVQGYGMIVPGLERALVGLRSGERKDVVVPPDEGYGERDEELVLEVDRSEMPRPAAVAVGDELVAESEEGEEAVLRVVEVAGDSVVLDGNHPLAGETLHYAVHVRAVRPATEEEIELAAASFERLREEQDEPEPAAGAGLVQIKRKN